MEKKLATDFSVSTIEDELTLIFAQQNKKESLPSSDFKIHNLGLFQEEKLVGIAQFCVPESEAMRKRYSRELTTLIFARNVDKSVGVNDSSRKSLYKVYVSKKYFR